MHKPLSDFDQIKASEELKQNTLMRLHDRNKQRKTWILPLGAGATAILCMILFFLWRPNEILTPIEPSSTVYAYVTFDINPSLEFSLDQNNQVIKVTAYNEDGEDLLRQMKFENLSLDDSVKQLIENEQIQTYMENGYLQVSVYSEDTKHSIELETKIDQTLGTYYDESQYGCTCASKRDHEKAQQHHMSFGRYQLIEMILTYDDSYTIEQLEGSSMRELKTLYESLNGSSINENEPGYGNGHHGNGHGNRHGS